VESQSAISAFGSYIVLFNAGVVALLLVAAGWYLGARKLTDDVPGNVQNFGEFVLEFFIGKARDMAPEGPERARVVRAVTPVLASFFLFIFVCNLMAVLPIPALNRPPTSHFSITLALAIFSVLATIMLSGAFKGVLGALKHLVWPNPMQWISEFTDVMSLSLRLFGNIGGEYMTVALVVAIVPFGIPLILHVLGLIPAFVQALVFTLLTASFISGAIHREEGARRRTAGETEAATQDGLSVEGGTGR
jgi:F-type H+-transporting ATPase subunit a